MAGRSSEEVQAGVGDRIAERTRGYACQIRRLRNPEHVLHRALSNAVRRSMSRATANLGLVSSHVALQDLILKPPKHGLARPKPIPYDVPRF